MSSALGKEVLIDTLGGSTVLAGVNYAVRTHQKVFPTSSIIVFVLGDAVYICALRKSYLTALSLVIGTPTDYADPTKFDMKQMVADASGKILATVTLNVLIQWSKSKEGYLGAAIDEVIMVTGGALINGAYNYVMNKTN